MAKKSRDMHELDRAMEANLEENTGKKLAQWLAVVKKSGLGKHGQIVKMLQGEHDVGYGYADLVARRALDANNGKSGSTDFVEAQYSGPKADLRPIYDRLVDRVEQFGDDVEIAPKKTYVSFRRNKQFGIIQPSTKTRVDVGIVLKDSEPEGRFEASGSFNSMMSHRVRVTEPDQVDDELVGWLERAYERA